jgi:hypothetical protein
MLAKDIFTRQASRSSMAPSPAFGLIISVLLLFWQAVDLAVAVPLENSRNTTDIALGPAASCTATTVSQAQQHISSGCGDLVLKSLRVPAVGPGGTALKLSLKKGTKVRKPKEADPGLSERQIC